MEEIFDKVEIVRTEERQQGKLFYTVYEIKYLGITCFRRYNQFSTLHKLLEGIFPVKMRDLTCRFPKKALFNRDPKFVEERRALLENYLRHVMAIPEICSSQAIKSFLDFNENSLENEVIFESEEYLTENGNES